MGFKDFGNSDILTNLLDTMTDGVMVVDENGTILCLNRSAEKITGYSSEELIGMPCTVLDTDACLISSGGTKVKKCELFKEGQVSNKRCQIKSKDGRNIMLLKNAAILRDENGIVTGAVETMTDVTSLFIKDMEIEELRQELSHEYGFMGLVGTCPSMRKVYEQIEYAARSDVPVIITGESGTGKELAAAAIHKLSRRNGGPFVRVNCAALNEHLLESELFGHRKGSFTGALRDHEGRFEAADKGSLFLDEVGDMPVSMQVKLLRALQEKEIVRIGDNHPINVDVRIITATNKDLSKLVEEGHFREDLYYRVNVFPIHIPPLRSRKEDLPVLISHYLKKISVVNQKKIHRLSPEAHEALEAFDWPGNTRQLINALEYGTITCDGDTIDVHNLPDYLAVVPVTQNRNIQERDDEKREIIECLERNQHNRTRSAKELGISRVGLWKKMKRLSIDVS
jgi:two-component system response regulator HydG